MTPEDQMSLYRTVISGFEVLHERINKLAMNYEVYKDPNAALKNHKSDQRRLSKYFRKRIYELEQRVKQLEGLHGYEGKSNNK